MKKTYQKFQTKVINLTSNEHLLVISVNLFGNGGTFNIGSNED